MVPAFQPQRFGSYVLTAHLGRGGMADVFRAQRTGAAGFERTCVVKRILRPYNDDQSFVEMFINEAKIAAQLTHPNIAQVYELGEVDGEYFMAMEYVKGMDLLHLLRFLAKRSPDLRHLPPEVAAYIALHLCRALAHAHDHTDERGRPLPIVHRDVSPQNIMIGFDGQVKVIDFGIAKAMFSMTEETRSGTLKGKIAYMSPEQVRGDNPGPESDIFSAGVVLYEMLIGRRLFKGENDFDTLHRVQHLQVPPPSRVAAWVQPELDAAVMQALQKDRALRYKRAASMARDLEEWLRNVRFSVEHMAEYLTATIPADEREKMAESQGVGRTPSKASGGSSHDADTGESKLSPQRGGMTNPSTPHARFAAGFRTPSVRRNALLVVAAVALAGGVVGLIALTRKPVVSVVDTVVAPPAPPAVKVEPLPVAPAPPPPSAPVPAPTPAPARREKAHSPAHAAKPAAAPPPPQKKPKIEILDDSEAAGKPKIDAFDD